MKEDGIRVRNGTAEDVGLLTEMGAETFYDSYIEDIAGEALAAFVAEAFGVEKQAAEMADEAVVFLIAEAAGEAVAYALLREWRVGPAALAAESWWAEHMGTGSTIELGRIYARKAWIGRGVGSALMRACLALAAERGCVVIWLGVWERNARAIRFYQKWGFEEVGEQVFMLGRERQRDVVMRRLIGS